MAVRVLSFGLPGYLVDEFGNAIVDENGNTISLIGAVENFVRFGLPGHIVDEDDDDIVDENGNTISIAGDEPETLLAINI